MLINQAPLEGQFVVLEPLTEQHIKPLEKAVADGDSPKLWFASVPTAEQMPAYVQRAIADMAQGNIAYAVRSKASGEVVRIPANVTGHSGDRDRFAHGLHAGTGFVL